ncbi:MBL fold metallo-hydrolase [Actibacterium mucosum]|uniref:MBL fold metallo-hydrolase n=1 Tax=Actibacterium mucosum TaxID=1087332 RepID=UPI0009DF7F0E|nr:MBL fold metallo-hydrolase [Actibacterium mucosum]
MALESACWITRVIVTHLHYDYAGGLHRFSNATMQLQAAGMAFTAATICPFTDHRALRACE